MGRQINFYMDQDAESAFIEEIMKEGQILCEGKEVTTKPIAVTAASELVQCSDESDLYLYQPAFGKLSLRTLPDGRVYIDTTKSPVIEFSRTGIDHQAKEVSSGRLWVKMEYWNDDENLVQKPDELGKWYNSLAKWIKKHLQKIDLEDASGDYWSLSIMELAKQGYQLL